MVPTASVAASTVLVAVSITETLLELIRDIGVFAIRGDGDPKGSVPTATVATTVLVAVSITETLLEPTFAT